jgi:hypothetical protein
MATTAKETAALLSGARLRRPQNTFQDDGTTIGKQPRTGKRKARVQSYSRADDDDDDNDNDDDNDDYNYNYRRGPSIEEYDSALDSNKGNGYARRSHTEIEADVDDDSEASELRRTLDAPWTAERRLVASTIVGEQRLQRIEAQSVAKQYARVLAEPQTEEDVEYQVDNDEDALRWRACKHPRYAELEATLGAPAPRSSCWGCKHGNKSLSSVSATRLDELQALYVENRHEVDASALGQLLEQFYEKHIRKPANEAIERRHHLVSGSSGFNNSRLELLPAWTAATIVDHFTNHRTEPAAKLSKRLDQVGALADHLYENGLFRAPANADPSAIKPSDIRVSEKNARLFMSSVTMELRLHASVPARMHGYNADLQLTAARPQQLVRSRHNMVEAIRMIKPFDTTAPKPL